MRNRHHHSTPDIVQDCLALLKRKPPTGKTGAHALQREKVAFNEVALRKVTAEAVEWRVELARIKEVIRKLHEQIANISGGNTNVAGINRRKKSNE